MKFPTNVCNVPSVILANTNQPLPTKKPSNLPLVDRWLLASLQKLIPEASEAFEGFQFNTAMEAIRTFTWHALADDYLEAVKHRLQTGREVSDLKATQY